jgi:hypothetical protein
VRWDRERARALGPAPAGAPLFITLGRRRRDGTHTRIGGRCTQAVLADVLKRLGAAAELPEELRHPHALRHTCATELLRAGANVADVRVFLGHASVKTTSVYLASREDRQEHVVELRERGRPSSTLTATPHDRRRAPRRVAAGRGHRGRRGGHPHRGSARAAARRRAGLHRAAARRARRGAVCDQRRGHQRARAGRARPTAHPAVH